VVLVSVEMMMVMRRSREGLHPQRSAVSGSMYIKCFHFGAQNYTTCQLKSKIFFFDAGREYRIFDLCED
jgi:hypothetical protein